MSNTKKTALADRKMVARAIKDSFVKLDPRIQVKNPVMLLVYIAAILTTVLWAIALFGIRDVMAGYTLAIAIILWFTVLFANFAEAIAEGRGKAQADALRAARKDVEAHVIPSVEEKERVTLVPSASLQKGDIITEFAGETVTSADDLNAIKAKQTSGDTVSVKIDRNGKEMTLDLVIPQPTEVDTASNK